MLSAAFVVFCLSLSAVLVSVWIYGRAVRYHRAAESAVRRARALRDEVVLIQIENDRLRREGVWCDGEIWHARYVVETAGATGGEAKAALMAAMAVAARVVPFRQRTH